MQGFLQRLYDNGHVYQDVYAGLYCVGCEAFKTEADLVDGKCPEHDREPEWIEERNWFFRLSSFQDQLLELYERADFVQPGFRANEARSFIEGGLQDFSISRAGQTWGIPIPWDPDSVAYVWADALVNYLSALTYAPPGRGSRRDVLAGGAAPARQGHPPLPLRLLARDAARGRLRAAPAALRPRLPAARRPEDLEVARQRRRPARPDRRLRRRSGAVLVCEGDLVRPGRHGVARGDPRALRARARERPRQPALADDGDGRPLPRGQLRAVPSPDGTVAPALAPLAARRRRATRPLRHHRRAGADLGGRPRAQPRGRDHAPWQLAKDEARADELDRVLYDLVDGLRAVAVALAAYVPGHRRGDPRRSRPAAGARLVARSPTASPARRRGSRQPRRCSRASSRRST